MKIRAAVICTAVVFSLSFAQYSNGSSSIYGVLSFPAGEFADSVSINSSGFAGIGPGVGLQYIVDPGVPYLDFVADVSVSYQYFDHDEAGEEFPLTLVESTEGGNYICVPILLAPRAKLVASQTELYASLMGGFNVLWQLDLDGSGEIFGVDYSGQMEFDDPAITFTWGVGAGVIVNERFTLGFRYLNLGNVEYDYSYSFEGSEPATDTRDFNASLMQITAGIQF
ncbi:MAG: hypothetical protein ACLFVQ_09775 [Chitinispirillaceae bacterium]